MLHFKAKVHQIHFPLRAPDLTGGVYTDPHSPGPYAYRYLRGLVLKGERREEKGKGQGQER